MYESRDGGREGGREEGTRWPATRVVCGRHVAYGASRSRAISAPAAAAAAAVAAAADSGGDGDWLTPMRRWEESK